MYDHAATATSTDHVDLLIIGAGVSGIGAAYHLQDELPQKTYAILDAREDLGGTWDLFRYPGIRSDSDLHTFGYAFKPWTNEKAIADGPAIKAYIRETAEENGIDAHIRYRHRVASAEFSTERGLWTVKGERLGGDDPGPFEMTAQWLYSGSGYYRYDQGYMPHFEGLAEFEGTIVHPQHWPEDLDYAGKRVVVIGSGATAVTLIPALADDGAGRVTMLQRSPTYVLPVPEKDGLAIRLRKLLGDERAYAITRRKNIFRQRAMYGLSQRFPRLARRLIRWVNKKELEGSGCDVDVHFKPKYGPWDQRLCAVPDGDLFRTIREGRAEVVTDTIETFTPKGIRLASGRELEADIIVTATGLNVLLFGGIEMSVDGEEVSFADTVAYKGMMLSDVPNFVFAIGYTNSSWTLKVDLVCEYMCRLIDYADRTGREIAVPEVHDPGMELRPLLDFQAGYVMRSLGDLPKQGTEAPWFLTMNYNRDAKYLRDSPVDEEMRFSSRSREPEPEKLAV
ncbi:MAG: NAD(P)/FAD-dependent oxidoreductase [Solirubrobacterales bacterium]|nr:NAD(P)/FAD-dependent oxidoreductase [Solirubrobacterales bacterium]MCB8970503.1 NAD(P)/FAD-dependent oxidoreductase [Thermoleophilales bacterium]MCO5325666.1 NAD(P)/FAD-dependent oxidoreductase [Solirubrobacterales bacterium]